MKYGNETSPELDAALHECHYLRDLNDSLSNQIDELKEELEVAKQQLKKKNRMLTACYIVFFVWAIGNVAIIIWMLLG